MISQPMMGKSTKQIKEERENLIQTLESEGHQIIDTVLDISEGLSPVYYLGESIKKMSEIKMGVKNPLFGKKQSEITKKKMSELYKGKHWRKNPVTGKREWYD